MKSDNSYAPKRHPKRAGLIARGINYSILEWGDPDSPLLVWLHGFADVAATFQFVVDALQHDWFVVAPDWRGFGETQVETRAFWFPDYLADLDQLLQHYSPDRPAMLVGHSMGGNVAGLYAGVLPERVAAFVNVEGFGLADTDPGEAPARYRDWLLKSRETPQPIVREDMAALVAAIRRRNPRLDESRAGFVARQWATVNEDGSVQLHVHPAHKLPNPVLYRRAEVEACWQKVTAPVLLVNGKDSDFPSPDGLPFPNATTREIDEAGHMLHLEQPGALARAIEEFLVNLNSTV